MIKPMLAETAKEPFDSDNHLYEKKIDGVRCVAYLDDATRLQSRSGADLPHKFPELQQLRKQVSKPCILDGEIACESFGGIQHRVHRENSLDIKLAMRQYPAVYWVFELVNLDSRNIMSQALIARKELLGLTFTNGENAKLLHFVYRHGISLFNEIERDGGEGIMAKNIHSPYLEGKRSTSWLKIKAFQEDTFVIGGLVRGENERAKTFGSLVLGKASNGRLEYVGCAGSGLAEGMLRHILEVVVPGPCPFRVVPSLDKEVLTWVSPQLVCEVRFMGLGSNGHLRFPTFRKLRLEQSR